MSICPITGYACNCQPDEGIFCDGAREIRQAAEGWKRQALSAVNCLREIAAMSRKVGSETAACWLQAHGYPREEGGYVPGKGFSEHPNGDE